MSLENVFIWLIFISVPIYLLAFILYSIRLIEGPTVFDSVLAVDCLSFDLAAFIAILAVYFKSAFLASSAIILALWAFLLDLYLAKYFLRKEVGT
ncbi:MAG TPA: pH regulation protein F [Euryarchaeota archaeon]|nr:pH regulation protein F [Euryarchaeota archaeon]